MSRILILMQVPVPAVISLIAVYVYKLKYCDTKKGSNGRAFARTFHGGLLAWSVGLAICQLIMTHEADKWWLNAFAVSMGSALLIGSWGDFMTELTVAEKLRIYYELKAWAIISAGLGMLIQALAYIMYLPHGEMTQKLAVAFAFAIMLFAEIRFLKRNKWKFHPSSPE